MSHDQMTAAGAEREQAEKLSRKITKWLLDSRRPSEHTKPRQSGKDQERKAA